MLTNFKKWVKICLLIRETLLKFEEYLYKGFLREWLPWAESNLKHYIKKVANEFE